MLLVIDKIKKFLACKLPIFMLGGEPDITQGSIHIHMLFVFCRNSTKKERRFLVIDISQLIMVEPDASRLGWGVVRFSGYLQVCMHHFLSQGYSFMSI